MGIVSGPSNRQDAQLSRRHLATRLLVRARRSSGAIDLSDKAEDQYRELQELGQFDTKTSSWLKTPAAIRRLGGAIFADRRYDHVFVYHNGASSYYGARGFRGSVRA